MTLYNGCARLYFDSPAQFFFHVANQHGACVMNNTCFQAFVPPVRVKLESVTPAHCPFPVCCNAFEHLVGIAPKIMAYRNHCWVNKCNTCTSSKRTQIKKEHKREKHPAFKFNKTVVRDSVREVRLKSPLDEKQAIVLEIANICNYLIINYKGKKYLWDYIVFYLLFAFSYPELRYLGQHGGVKLLYDPKIILQKEWVSLI